MDGFNLSEYCIDTINQLFPGERILEFGSGEGTKELLKEHNVISIEHDEKYMINYGEGHVIHYCPIKDGWYSKQELIFDELKKADLILVDGPPRELRNGILNNLNLFEQIGCPIIFDDIQRNDFKIMIEFCEKMNYSYSIFVESKKSFGVCIKNE